MDTIYVTGGAGFIGGYSVRQLVAERTTFVEDRPGHDRRYALDARKIRQELGWVPQETFASGLIRTVRWVARVTAGTYRRERLGLVSMKGETRDDALL